MGTKYSALTQEHIDFIATQKIFFTATATVDSFINLSPKGLDSLKVIDENLVIFLNKVGSGNESAAHIQQSQDNPRMTIMFCSFAEKPLILRLYGKAIEIKKGDENWDNLLSQFDDTIGVRQIFAVDIELVQASCGFGVPFFNYAGDRKTLNNWAQEKGQAGLEDYKNKKNTISLNDSLIKI